MRTFTYRSTFLYDLELETEGLQKQEEEEEEELGILQYLDQLEQVTARYFGRLVITLIKGTVLRDRFQTF